MKRMTMTILFFLSSLSHAANVIELNCAKTHRLHCPSGGVPISCSYTNPGDGEVFIGSGPSYCDAIEDLKQTICNTGYSGIFALDLEQAKCQHAKIVNPPNQKKTP